MKPDIMLYAAAQGAWIVIRRLGRALLGTKRFDRLIDKTGLRELKSRTWLSRKMMPDGNEIMYRPHDQCVLDEVYARDVYSQSKIKAGETVVDVGAHIGIFSLMAARKVGPTGRVIAFEPSPRTLDLLRRNLAFNGLPWVKLHAVALADVEGTTSLFMAEGAVDNPVADTLIAASKRKSVPVRLRRLDDVLAEEDVAAVDHLKIDVEGAELRVLDGAPKTLARTRRVVMEVHQPHVDPNEARRRLEAAGFDCRLGESASGVILEALRQA